MHGAGEDMGSALKIIVNSHAGLSPLFLKLNLRADPKLAVIRNSINITHRTHK
jgi:hypothetical protein